MSFSALYAKLRRKNIGQYALLSCCCFFSVMLMTSYIFMMRSPTILTVLPEGGDSRKQVMMIFVLAVIGCAVFTTYAAGLFFRQKSKETGVFLALGASKKQLKSELWKELSIISIISCGSGAILGIPLAYIIWNIFRLFIVDTQEMILNFDINLYIIIFIIYVIFMLFIMGYKSIMKTNIIDIIKQTHSAEPVHCVPKWFGVIGIILLILGGFCGYIAPSVFILGLHWYPPKGLTAIFYIPALIGLYMILLHTVSNGWSKRKKYKDIISVSMMKFQGRQTVRNMLVMTLLIAGAYFGSFYTPMLGTGAIMSFDDRPVDYAYHFRADQNIPQKKEVFELANKYGVKITSWANVPMARLGVDGEISVEKETSLGTTWESVYYSLLKSDIFLSKSSYEALTGEDINIKSGEIAAIMDASGDGQGIFDGNTTLVTNTLTGESWSFKSIEHLCNDILFGRYVVSDEDYLKITNGLTLDCQEQMVFFNVENDEQTYDFAKALFNEIVDHSGEEVAVYDSFDPILKQIHTELYGYYFLDEQEPPNYDNRDSSDFRMYWQYMPKFRVLDKADFIKTTAVFLMLFIFISIICFVAVIVIAFTRSITIAISNKKIYDDLRHLGASNDYLNNCAKSQVKKVFFVPIITGTSLIYIFYSMIMFFNDNRLTLYEIAGLLVCLALIAIISFVLYLIYRLTLKKVCNILKI